MPSPDNNNSTNDEETPMTGAAIRAQEAAGFLLFTETSEHVAENWKSILLVGIINIVAGIGCLVFPVLATQLTEIYVVVLVFGAGLINIFSFCAAATGSNQVAGVGPLFWIGICEIVLAVVMYLNPFATLTLLTLVVAATFMVLGSFQMAAACTSPTSRRHRMAARALMITSGGVSVLLSVLICLSMPIAAWYTIGVLVGVNLVNVGVNRIVLGLYGRELAESSERAEDWHYYLNGGHD